ncbi:hypothetical protein ACTFIV_007110 [Dictyostelium citrinum]
MNCFVEETVQINKIYRKLKASRFHSNLGVLKNNFSIGLAASFIENGGIIDYKICFFVLLICIFINNIGFLMNSYLDYIFNVDSVTSVDKTLFNVTSTKSILNYIIFSILMVFLLVFLIIPLTITDLDNQVYKMIIIISIISLTMALGYNYFKYIALVLFIIPKIIKLWVSTNKGNTILLNVKASDIHLTACPLIVFSILMSP